METEAALTSLNALAHTTRLAAYRQLVQAGPEGLSVGDLRDRLDVPPATLTAHLNILRSAGLVADEREGRVIRVRADYARMDALLGYLTENCCADSRLPVGAASAAISSPSCCPPTKKITP